MATHSGANYQLPILTEHNLNDDTTELPNLLIEKLIEWIEAFEVAVQWIDARLEQLENSPSLRNTPPLLLLKSASEDKPWFYPNQAYSEQPHRHTAQRDRYGDDREEEFDWDNG